MSSTNFAMGGDHLPPDVTRQIVEICDEFKRVLDFDGNIALEPFLARVDPIGRDRLLDDLCLLAIVYLRAHEVSDVYGTILAANLNLRSELQASLNELVSAQTTQSFINRSKSDRPRDVTRAFSLDHGLHIRCPHCSNPVELLADTPNDLVKCTHCGSDFSLIDRSDGSGTAEALQRLGRFDLLGRLGVGGFGTVWKARDTQLDRIVALKIPRRHQLEGQELELFLREARTAAQLRHPNIVPVHEIGREEDTIFIVSDLIHGVTLTEWLSRRRLAPREVAMLMTIIADALDHAHKSGVIHRDLKPSNIMIDEAGQPHIMDFGLAKRAAEEIAMTVDGQIMGTPAYMSPEQASGDSQWVDRRCDVYSLGVILFELLTGELPYRGNAQMQILRRQSDDAPAARTLNRHVPRDLETICAKCLERQTQRRYDSAHELAEELRRFQDNVPIKARPVSRPERFVRWTRRNPLLATTAALVCVLAAVGPALAFNEHRLRQLEVERYNIITSSQHEISAGVNEQSRLKQELSILQGTTSPWELWPPSKERPPQAILTKDLYEHSNKSLTDIVENPAASQLDKVRANLALASMEQLLGNRDQAAKNLLNTVELLKDLSDSHPNSAAIAAALARTIDSYTAIAGLEHSKEIALLEEARAIRERLAKADPKNVERRVLWFGSEVHYNTLLGREGLLRLQKQAVEIRSSIAQQWPSRVADTYKLAALLAGQECLLADDADGFLESR